MKLNNYLVILSGSLIINLVTAAQPTTNASKVQLEILLNRIGQHYDKYFTVENASGVLEDERVTVSGLPNTADVFLRNVTNWPVNISSVLADITNTIANTVIIQDVKNTNILHIIDRRVFAVNKYALDEKLSAIKFEGTAEKFVTKISATVPNLKINNSGVVGASECLAANFITRVSIDIADVCVREALSLGNDLKGYHRIIWTASTSPQTGITRVKYEGPQ